MAVSEALIESGPLCLFVTHFPQIVGLAQLYVEVKNVHLTSSTSLSTAVHFCDEQLTANLNHKLCAGPCTETSGYGISLARKCGFPDEIIEDAVFIATKLRAQYPLLLDKSSPCQHYSILSDLLSKLLILKNSSLNKEGIQVYLQNIREKIGAKDADILATAINNSTYPTTSSNASASGAGLVSSFQAG